MKEFYEKYKHGVPLVIFGAVYLLWFYLLEHRGPVDYMVVHMNIDDYIPFCEAFVVPYLLWFLYVPAVVLYLFFKDKDGYYNCGVFLCTGMTVFLILSTFIPNIQHLRLHTMPRDNIFTQMIAALWQTDTPTNLFPSIHVYNSIGTYIAIHKSPLFQGKTALKAGAAILTAAICLSTVFLKQHSVIDGVGAGIMAAMMYHLVYACSPVEEEKKIVEKILE